MTEAPLELEGTWEEIRARDGSLRGTYVRVTVLSREPNASGEPERWVDPGMQEAFRRAAEIQAGMEFTSGEHTQELIREARNGGMYGLDPTD